MRFLAICFFVITVLLFGILFGIYQATQIIGTDREKEAVEVTQSPIKKAKLKQEEQPEGMTLLERQERAQEIQAMNVYSELGGTIGDGVESMFKQLITSATTGMNDLLNSQ